MIGRVIGTYKIEQKLGEGGMGSVYKGVDTMLDREVAIKALKPELASQTAIVERFRTEAVTLAKLNHPNIATLYSLFRQGDELYMVLEYVRGESLDELLARRGALEADEIIPVICQILDGIDHAHEFGIVHRDIKPANMMLTENGTLKVLDFGIARLLGSNRMTRAGNVIGTLEYMAPEQVRGLETDARSDIYALGMMLYEILTGKTPFDTDNEFELMKMQIETIPPSPRTLKPSIPEEVEAAIMKAIEKDPEKRFQAAGEFREALLTAGFAESGSLRRITGPGNRTAPPIAITTPISNPDAPPITAPPPPISVPDVPLPTLSDDQIKETRFVAPAAAGSVLQGNAPETRLGSFPPPAAALAGNAAASESFFSKLTWVHYAGAGSLIVLFGIFLLTWAVVIFSGGFLQASSGPASNVESGSNSNSAGISVPADDPANTDRAVETTPVPVSTPEKREVAPIPVTPAETPEVPVETPSEPPATKKAPAPKKAPAKPPSKPRKGNLKEARCALTGDC